MMNRVRLCVLSALTVGPAALADPGDVVPNVAASNRGGLTCEVPSTQTITDEMFLSVTPQRCYHRLDSSWHTSTDRQEKAMATPVIVESDSTSGDWSYPGTRG